MASQLEQLSQFSTIVADTSDLKTLAQYKTQDATTNPKLILDAIQDPQFKEVVEENKNYALRHTSSLGERQILFAAKTITQIGAEMLRHIPGRVSTEVDPQLSYDTKQTLQQAKLLIALYEKLGIARERILIKIAATWEGIRAAEELEKEGIHCNLTVLFSLTQALACAEAKVTLISPFVGRLTEWYQTQSQLANPATDQGVQLIHAIYHYFKKFGIKTQIMAASFRKKQQILAIAGVDLITIPPALLQELAASSEPIAPKLVAPTTIEVNNEPLTLDKDTFYRLVAQDRAAKECLTNGILKFTEAYLQMQKVVWG